MKRLHKRRKAILEKGPCMLLEIWHRIRPKLIDQIAAHALSISGLLLLFCSGSLILWLFHGWEQRVILGFHLLLGLRELRKLHSDS